jgi:putative transcriptional regulator
MNRIQEVLDQKGIKQIQLADALGVARSSISQYCSNTIQPPISRLVAISEYLNCDIVDLLKSKKNKK